MGGKCYEHIVAVAWGQCSRKVVYTHKREFNGLMKELRASKQLKGMCDSINVGVYICTLTYIG